MEALGTLLAIVTVIIVTAYVAQPFLAPRREDETRVTGKGVEALKRRASLLAERNRIYRAIKELDFEFQTGKVAEADYADQRFALVAQGVEILQQIDALPPSDDDPMERAVLAFREGEPLTYEDIAPLPDEELTAEPVLAGGPQSRFCGQCGTRAQTGDRFCANCGAAL